MTDLKNAALTASAVLLAVLILATLVRAVIGPRFTDRVIAVNMLKAVFLIGAAAAHFKTVANSLEQEGFLDPRVLRVDINALLWQVPGGMLSNLIAQLRQIGREDLYETVLAEIPNVRRDFGYPPLVTPSSQIVGSQAVLNVITGKRYQMFSKESKAMLKGEYGRLPGEVNPEVLQKAGIREEDRIICRPADLLQPELPENREKYRDLAQSEEDVLSLTLFPQVAEEFLSKRRNTQ